MLGGRRRTGTFGTYHEIDGWGKSMRQKEDHSGVDEVRCISIRGKISGVSMKRKEETSNWKSGCTPRRE